MTRRKAQPAKPERRFVVYGQRRDAPDLRKLARVLLAVALTDQQGGDEQAEETSAEPEVPDA